MRIDKWLWATRFFKTRSLATDEILKGRVQVNGQEAKPAREIKVGDTVAADDILLDVETDKVSMEIPAPSAGVITQILNGYEEHGMPPFRDVLKDREIAAIVNFVRNSFGNDFGAIQPTDVAAFRGPAK